MESFEQLRLGDEKRADGRVDARLALRGHDDEDASAVVRVGAAVHKATLDEPVDAVRHGAGGDKGLLQERLGAQLVGGARPAQRGEDVEFPGVELRGRERFSAGAVEVTRESPDAGEHLKRCEVEVWSFACPRLDDPVDLVVRGHAPIIPAAPRVLDEFEGVRGIRMPFRRFLVIRRPFSFVFVHRGGGGSVWQT